MANTAKIQQGTTAKTDWASQVEQWADVRGFEGYYQVSSLGRVRSLDRHKLGRGRIKLSRQRGRLMKPKVDKYGYNVVQLSKDGQRTFTTVHRLVAMAFIPNPNNYDQVNHIDCDKLNNRTENLEWCTAKQNVIHAHKNGNGPNIKRGRHGFAKLVLNVEMGIFYDCGKDAAEAHCIHYDTFKDLMRGRRKRKNPFVYA